MPDAEAIRVHEQGALKFLHSSRRARNAWSLEKRGEFPVASLQDEYDPKWRVDVPGSWGSVALLRELRARGAPDTCVVLQDDEKHVLPLAEAVDVRDDGDAWWVLVSCLPGKLAYFQGEHTKLSFLLDRRVS